MNIHGVEIHVTVDVSKSRIKVKHDAGEQEWPGHKAVYAHTVIEEVDRQPFAPVMLSFNGESLENIALWLEESAFSIREYIKKKQEAS